MRQTVLRLTMIALASASWPTFVQAQQTANAQQTNAPLNINTPAAERHAAAGARAMRESELERVRADQRRAAETELKLKRELESIGQDRRKLAELLVATATKLREAEERVAATEDRLGGLDEQEQAIRGKLYARRHVIADLLAALQRMGQRPPPALLVRPEDALKTVRSAMLLGAVVPAMRAETEALAIDLAAQVNIRAAITAEREALAKDAAGLEQERVRMTALVEERQRRQVEAERALEGERGRMLALARQADSLKDLIAKLDRSAPAETTPPPDQPESQPRDTNKLKPSILFANAKGSLKLPVGGIKIRNFGSSDGLGSTQKGISIASRIGAQVTAPTDGWVVYAGPFRSYGQLLILNVGGGYHVLLAGMERISVDLGQFVLTGEPVASMGNGPKTAAAIPIGSSQPTLYIEFRKDGTPVDPGPWWTADSEKVRG